MVQQATAASAVDIADRLLADVEALSKRNTPNIRAVRRQYSREIRGCQPELVLDLAVRLLETSRLRWVAYELIRHHKTTFESLTDETIERIGRGLDSWQSVDAFGCTLSGPAWRIGSLSDSAVHRWAVSEDVWWRRAALVSTVGLNPARGAARETPRELSRCAVCWPTTTRTWCRRQCPGRFGLLSFTTEKR